jgi:N-acetylmuramic acid 6-phosphate etherase
VQASNKKLVHRSEKILARLSGRSGEEIQEALERAGGSVKLAFLLLQGCERDTAEAALHRAEGHLRRAMSLIAELHPHLHGAKEPRHALADPDYDKI